MGDRCPVCKSSAVVQALGALDMSESVQCPTCGNYIITRQAKDEMNPDVVASWLYYNSDYNEEQKQFSTFFYISSKDTGKMDPNYVTLEEISNWYPRSFNEKVDRFLLLLANKNPCLGGMEFFKPEQMISAIFAHFSYDSSTGILSIGCTKQCQLFFDYLHEQRYITDDSNPQRVTLSPYGWQRIDELQKNNPNNRDIFIAMAFPDEDSDEKPEDLSEIKDTIKAGITKAQYNPIIMCDTIHGEQIVPKMFRLIRESKLLVMDVTCPNLGAYHEAGFALGLGKEVIITCREKEFNDPDNKPHFDIAQKQILVWKDYEDLIEKLSEWIKEIAR